MARSIRTRVRRLSSRRRERWGRRSRAGGRRSEPSSSPVGMPRSTAWSDRRSGRNSTPRNLQKNAVAYINCDVAVTGPDLGLNGVPSLLALAQQAARDVPDPARGGSVGARWESRLRSAWAQQTPVSLEGRDVTFAPRLAPLGSGSDYTVFLDHLGIPVIDAGFGGPYGVYHSVYDNFRWMDTYGDPGFHYHAAAARLLGLMTMRLASADIVPLRFGSYAASLQEDLDVMRRDAIRRARTSHEGQKPAITPDFAEIVAALSDLASAGEAADRAAEAAAKSGDRRRHQACQRDARTGGTRVPGPEGPSESAVVPPHVDSARADHGLCPVAVPSASGSHRSARRDDVRNRSEARRGHDSCGRRSVAIVIGRGH